MSNKKIVIPVQYEEDLPPEHIEGYDIIVRVDKNLTIQELIKVRPF